MFANDCKPVTKKYMKQYILNIILLIVGLIVCNQAWGQTTLPKTGSLSGNYKVTSNQTQTGTLTVDSGKSATINLNGQTLNGNNIQIFNISGTLTINGPGIIINGKAANGGCAYITGKMTITNATIKDCSASNDGGAFYVNNGTLIIENGELSHNSAERLGGAICKAGTSNTLTIQGNTKIHHNSAKHSGGAIYARTLNIKGNSQSDPVVIEYNKATNYDGADPTFTQNSNNAWVSGITGQGGGIYIPTSSTASEPFDDMKCDIEFCNIQYNYAAINGGGIFSGINTDIDNSKIIYNTAMSSEKREYEVSTNSGRGGGFYFVGYYRAKEHKDGELIRNSRFKLTNTEVNHNAAMYYGGGGQLGTRAILTMSESQINNNRAVIHGAGGLHLTADVTFNFESGEINNNEAYTVGGGIHTSYGCTLNLNGGSISGNIAHQRGGGVHVNTGGSLVLNGTNITGNKVYQGKDMAYATVIKNSNGTFTWDPTSLDYKRVNESGYKYENNDDDKYLVDTGYGGGVLIDSGTCTMNTGDLSNNYAEVAGGGLALVMIRISDSESDFGRLKVVNFQLNKGTISGNESDGNGAGVYLMRNKISEMISQLSQEAQTKLKAHANYETLTKGIPTATIVNGSLMSNYARSSGAAIMMEEGNFYVNGTTSLQSNSSESNGGGVYIGGGSFSVKDAASLIADSNSSTKGDGGAIYLGKGAFTMYGSASADIKNNNAQNGGAIYAAGDITLTGNTNISNNNASQNGGALYVNGGSITATAATITSNQNKAANGGVFYVNNGSVILGTANMSENTVTSNGGAIALYNGAFSMAKTSNIRNNKATNFGGGLYVYNQSGGSQKTISCTGGTFSGNTAKAGGAVSADGNIKLTLAASMEANSANIGGGIYMTNGVQMTFGEGLIRSNSANGIENISYTTASNKDASDVSGVGGGIFMANNSTLEFNSAEMGIYNNYATNAGADICSNGTGTKIILPAIGNMSLRGFDVPGNDLYWVYDFFTDDDGTDLSDPMRYEDMLLVSDPTFSIVKYILEKNSTHTFDNYVCLDLGYDLVFVELTTSGLSSFDNLDIMMSYPRLINPDDPNDKRTEDILYRTVLFNGEQTKIVGLPSGDWKFSASDWIIDYKRPTFNNKAENTALKIDRLNKNISINISPIEQDAGQPDKRKAKVYESYRVNRMIP